VKIAAFRLRLEKRTADLGLRIERLLAREAAIAGSADRATQERGPLKVLERGYAIATDAAGNLLRLRIKFRSATPSRSSSTGNYLRK